MRLHYPPLPPSIAPPVFAEDAAALVGLAIGAAGLALHQITGSSVPDAIGSILIGLLLGAVAIIPIEQNRRFLVGQEPHRSPRPARLVVPRHEAARRAR